jgi:predicted ATPase/DNA-binding winged helix-turn-helix (wHTH) protein
MAAGSDPGIGETVSFGPFRLVPAERLLTRDGMPVSIGGRALDTLIALTNRAPAIVNGRDLVNLVWPDVTVEEANIRVHVAALRKALGHGRDGSRYVVTVPGRGYTFVAPLRRVSEPGANGISAQISAASPGSLPPPVRYMVGREESIAELASQVWSHRCVSVIGPGGIGKTTVAIAVAHALARRFGTKWAFFVDLGSLGDKMDVASAVAGAIGCPVQGLAPETALLEFLADKRALIVLDSCEHVIDAVAPLAARIFAEAPAVHLLSTTREALRIEGENAYLLSPLEPPVDDAATADSALVSPAVQLFMERAAASGHLNALSDDDAPVVADICRRLDGIALAIELAASRVGTYGIVGVANLLSHASALQLKGRRSATPRHQTLHAMLDWSFNLLSHDERRTLCMLSAFVGQFPLEAAYAVADAGDTGKPGLAAVIAGLVDKSLVSVVPGGGPASYRLLDTTRVYAAGLLKDNEERRTIAFRHALYFNALLRSVAIDAPGFDGREAARFASHLGNIRKALVWCFSDSGDETIGRHLAADAALLFFGLSQFEECQQWCRKAIQVLDADEPDKNLELRLYYALARSVLFGASGSSEITEVFEHALRLSAELADKRRQFALLTDFNIHLVRNGDFKNALATARESVAIAERSGDTAEQVLAEWMLGATYQSAGNLTAALHHCRHGFRLGSDSGPLQLDLASEARARIALARSLWLRGFPDQALDTAHETLELMARYSHHASYCFTLVWTVPIFFWCGEFDAASKPVDVALAHATKHRLSTYESIARSQKGVLTILRGDASAGLKMLEDAHSTLVAGPYNVFASPTACLLAKGLVNAGRSGDAHSVIVTALSRADQVDEQSWRPELLRTMGEVLLQMSEPDAARGESFLVESLQCAQKQAAVGWELKAALQLAGKWEGTGRITDAESVLSMAYQRFSEGYGTRDLLLAREMLKSLRQASKVFPRRV